MAGATRIGGISFGVSMHTRKLDKAIKTTRGKIQSFVSSITGVSSSMLGAGAAAAALGLALKKLGTRYEDINRSMTRSLAIMGDVSDVMRKDMTNAAIQVASQTQFSTKQAADAYFFLASAGLDANQSIAALPQVSKFAQAGNFDLARATDLATDAQSALGLTVNDSAKNLENMTRVTDVLIKANSIANATTEQFSDALTNKAAASLRFVNKDIEEGVAALAAFADQGLKGADAGTALSIVLRDLQTKAIKNKEAFAQLGVSVFDGSGNMRNLADVIGNLEDRLDGLSVKQKKAALIQLGFSDKSVQFTQILLGMSDKMREYETATRNAGGATEKVAGSSLTAMQKATAKLGAAFDTLAQNMGPIVSLLADSLDFVTQIINKVTKTPKVKFVSGVDVAKKRRDFIGAQSKSIIGNQSISNKEKNKQRIQSAGLFRSLSDQDIILLDKGISKFKSFTKELPSLISPQEIAGKAKKAVGGFLARRENRKRAGAETLKGQQQFGGQLIDSVVGKIGKTVGDLRSKASAKAGEASLAFQFLQGKARNFALDAANKPAMATVASPSLATAGSVEAFRKRVAIQNKNPAIKLDKTRNKTLESIDKTLKENKGPATQPANL